MLPGGAYPALDKSRNSSVAAAAVAVAAAVPPGGPEQIVLFSLKVPFCVVCGVCSVQSAVWMLTAAKN